MICLEDPHPAQREILLNRKRFNHVQCGRRFGKTSLIRGLCVIALQGCKVGIFFPTYPDLNDLWEDIKAAYSPAYIKKDEQLKQIYFPGGGKIDFWSMENPDTGRGRSYHRVVIDEGAKAKKLKQAWTGTIRPTLTDYRGDAFFLSTPKGKGNYFYKLKITQKDNPEWAFFQKTSFDNPFLPPGEVEAAKGELDELMFAQEFLAKDIDINEKPFLYMFDETRHVMKSGEILPTLPIWCSFDFNVNPMTTGIGQRKNINTLHVHKEHSIMNAGVYEMCDVLNSEYTRYQKFYTGDATGTNRSTATRGVKSNWHIIKQEMRASDSQIKIRASNLQLYDSRVLCNSLLQHANITIDPSCTGVISDCRDGMADKDGKLIKDEGSGMHNMDWFRYLLDANFPDFVHNYKKYQLS